MLSFARRFNRDCVGAVASPSRSKAKERAVTVMEEELAIWEKDSAAIEANNAEIVAKQDFLEQELLNKLRLEGGVWQEAPFICFIPPLPTARPQDSDGS